MATNVYIELPVQGGGSSAGVSSLNSLIGAITISAGTGISIGEVGNSIIITAVGSASTIGALDSQTENANGLALVGGVLSSQSADATHPGMVNITTQTFSGTKTFTNTSAVQAVFGGWEPVNGAKPTNGCIAIGTSAAFQGLIHYADFAETSFYLDNTFDNASAAIYIRTRTSGTPVLNLSLFGDGTVHTQAAVVADTIDTNQFALNSAGANYGFISNQSANIWSLGYGTTIGVLATPVLSWNASGLVTVVGPISSNSIGSGYSTAEGANAKQGIAVLSGGTVIVSNTSVTANSRIFLTTNIPGGTPGAVYISARTAGISFTITSTSVIDASTVAFEIFEPS